MVRHQLMKVEGVIDVEVSAAESSATVTCLKSVKPEEVAKAVRGDFTAKVR